MTPNDAIELTAGNVDSDEAALRDMLDMHLDVYVSWTAHEPDSFGHRKAVTLLACYRRMRAEAETAVREGPV